MVTKIEGRLIGLVMGKKGATIREIQSITHAQVQIVRDNGGRKISGGALAEVVFSGSQSSMLHAQTLLQVRGWSA